MKNGTGEAQAEAQRAAEAITRITVAGFKAIRDEQSIEIRPLTILAGANSSGKSSMMQPLLLLKQTLEASYDPGPLLLNGPNVRFTESDQLLAHGAKGESARGFHIGLAVEPRNQALTIHFKIPPDKQIEIEEMAYAAPGDNMTLRPGMSHSELLTMLPQLGQLPDLMYGGRRAVGSLSVVRNRCFLVLGWTYEQNENTPVILSPQPVIIQSASDTFARYVREMIHVPALRGNSERFYPASAAGPNFPGRFDEYAASVIAAWQTEKQSEKLEHLRNDLIRLGLNWTVIAERVNDAQLRLLVGRVITRGRATDLVSVADVGFGVAQALPVLVALLVAQPGQLVYVEQPESHLHPRAQVAMASVLADAAARGVRVVVETHSDLLILGVQTLVAEGKLDPGRIKLHWFAQQEDGTTAVSSRDMDESGRYSDWPEDFAEVELAANNRYLNAAESRLISG